MNEELNYIASEIHNLAQVRTYDWWMLVVGISSIFIATLVARFTYKIYKKQLDLMKTQTDISEKQAEIMEEQNKIALHERRYETYVDWVLLITRIKRSYSTTQNLCDNVTRNTDKMSRLGSWSAYILEIFPDINITQCISKLGLEPTQEEITDACHMIIELLENHTFTLNYPNFLFKFSSEEKMDIQFIIDAINKSKDIFLCSDSDEFKTHFRYSYDRIMKTSITKTMESQLKL